MKFPLVLAAVFTCLLLVSQDVAVADNRKLTGDYNGTRCGGYGCGNMPPDGSYPPGAEANKPNSFGGGGGSSGSGSGGGGR